MPPAIFKARAIRENAGAILTLARTGHASKPRIAIGESFLRAFLPGDNEQAIITQVGARRGVIQCSCSMDQNVRRRARQRKQCQLPPLAEIAPRSVGIMR